MINIAELLKDAPKGMKLYSPLFGEVEFMQLGKNDQIWVRVDNSEPFDKYGRYFGTRFTDAECLLFPSKDCRTWEGWKLPVEPKFKVGDWLLYHNTGIKVLIIGYSKLCGYKVRYINSEHYIDQNVAENDCRLWTIKDAKDGDVLANDAGCIFINAGFEKDDKVTFASYCYVSVQGDFYEEDHCTGSWLYASHVKPATKEQRNLLFAKMKEAGYEWDADKKELRKIIVPKFKVGDEIKTGNTIDTIAEINYATRSYSCESGRTIWFENEDMWHLAPKPHYDIKNFYAGMPVLVRDCDEHKWLYTLFGIYNKDNSLYPFVVVNMRGYEQCIPFEGNEHLLGTTDMPSEEFINW